MRAATALDRSFTFLLSALAQPLEPPYMLSGPAPDSPPLRPSDAHLAPPRV
jgi:hypothetical protein